jgi:hypothetical protein
VIDQEELRLLRRKAQATERELVPLYLLLASVSQEDRIAAMSSIREVVAKIHKYGKWWVSEKLTKILAKILAAYPSMKLSKAFVQQLSFEIASSLNSHVDTLQRRVVAEATRLSGDFAGSLSEAAEDTKYKPSVPTVGSDGKLHRYALAYWLELQVEMTLRSAARQAVIYHATSTGSDLVQISPQPSTIGDFCDLYKGKVFSVSGTDPYYHPLSVVPNGGAPMHIWCHHYLLPFSGAVRSASLQSIPDEFLELGRSGASTAEFQRAWLRSKKKVTSNA